MDQRLRRLKLRRLATFQNAPSKLAKSTQSISPVLALFSPVLALFSPVLALLTSCIKRSVVIPTVAKRSGGTWVFPANPSTSTLACSATIFLSLLGTGLLITGCGHRRVNVAAPPPPPATAEVPAESIPSTPIPEKPLPPLRGKVLTTEIGLASWYGPPYHHRRAANGQIYDQDAMTAAHRTLPLGTVVRVTNVATRQSATVTITDRGPFVPGRMIDLSRAAAKKIGVWRAGVARVRVDVLRAPQPLNRGGRWCVQIGVFHHGKNATKLRDRLQRKYPDANVIEFTGPTGHWVRIKPAGEAHRQAAEIASKVRPAEGEAYLVRLD